MSESKKILLVIEDANLEKILTYLLKAWGYAVLLSNDGRQALSLATDKHPDLIIIDAHLSKMDGLSLCKLLKLDFISAYIPIIILIEKKQLRRSLLDIEEGVDDFLIKPPDPIDLEIRIALSLKSADHQFHANALTKLPGNRAIEKVIGERLDKKIKFSFAYLDINNFKSFNDKYGYLAGDRVLLQTSKIITSAVKQLGNPRDFVGHIGGDDFIYVSTQEREELIAQECINEFDRLSPLHYAPEDRKRGFIKARDRSGHFRHISLMGLSIAIVNNTSHAHSLLEFTETASEIKKFLKKQPESNYLVNRRVSDTADKDHAGLQHQYTNELKRHAHAIKACKPFGQIMLESHTLNEEQLNEALGRHWTTGLRLGEAAVSLGFTDEDHIKTLLKHQPTLK